MHVLTHVHIISILTPAPSTHVLLYNKKLHSKIEFNFCERKKEQEENWRILYTHYSLNKMWTLFVCCTFAFDDTLVQTIKSLAGTGTFTTTTTAGKSIMYHCCYQEKKEK